MLSILLLSSLTTGNTFAEPVFSDLSVQRDSSGYLDLTKIQFLKETQTAVLNDNFSKADSMYALNSIKYPNDPTYPLFYAASLMAQMTVMEEPINSELFNRLLDRVDSLTNCRLKDSNDKVAAWIYLLKGHRAAYLSLWEGRFGSKINSIKAGFTVAEQYENGLERDSSLTDIYAGIGAYHYWKSVKAGILRKIGIFKDEKEKGLNELYRAVDSSILHRPIARSALIWIYLHEQEYDSSISISKDMCRIYPNGKTYLWPLAQAYFRKESFHQARGVYQMLRLSLEAEPGNYHNLVDCDYYLAQCYNWLGENEKMIHTSIRATEYFDVIPKKTLHRQRSKISFLRNVANR